MTRRLHIAAILLVLSAFTSAIATSQIDPQEQPPRIPDKTDQVYFADQSGKLQPIAFETAQTPIKVNETAKEDKTSYVEVRGPRSGFTISSSDPRIYIFVPDIANTHPSFLVHFDIKKGNRRITALTERGRTGYAVSSDQIVKPHYRVIGKKDGLQFMEIRPREPLVPGEYAIMGSDLSRIASFSIGTQ